MFRTFERLFYTILDIFCCWTFCLRRRKTLLNRFTVGVWNSFSVLRNRTLRCRRRICSVVFPSSVTNSCIEAGRKGSTMCDFLLRCTRFGFLRQKRWVKCWGIFSGGLKVFSAREYLYHRTLYRDDVFFPSYPTKQFRVYSVGVFLESDSSAWLRRREDHAVSVMR